MSSDLTNGPRSAVVFYFHLSASITRELAFRQKELTTSNAEWGGGGRGGGLGREINRSARFADVMKSDAIKLKAFGIISSERNGRVRDGPAPGINTLPGID